MKIQRNYGIKLLYLFFIINVFMCMLVNVDCSVSGMVAPIEVVQELGCRDTEIRLTCGPLESKIAILDATFTPDCSNSEADNCDNLYEPRLMGTYIPTKTHLRNEEKIAGKKFLETLRKAPDDVYLNDDPAENGLADTDDIDSEILSKEEKVSLKESLEALIVKYLRKLSPEDYDDEDYMNNRNRRTTNNETEYEMFNYTEIETGVGINNRTPIVEYNEEDVEQVENIEIYNDNAVEKIIVTPTNKSNGDDEHSSDNSVKSKRPIKLKKVHSDNDSNTICSIRSSQQTQLDRFELDKSINYDFKNEFNIRGAVAHRCSGKNHCSFVFGTDHPYSVVWDSGTVRIKYICMDNFRINKYCAERLIIGNEVELNENEMSHSARYTNMAKDKMYTKPRGEPVAEARIQLDQQQFHQFTNVKIIKTAPQDDSTVRDDLIQPNIDSNEKLLNEYEKRRRQRVYSQDFKILKILPKDPDHFNTIEQIGDEFYFKKDGSNNIDKGIVANEDTTSGPQSKENLFEINKISTNIPIVIPPPPSSPSIVKDSEIIILPTIIIEKIDLDILPRSNETYLDDHNEKLTTPSKKISTTTYTTTNSGPTITTTTTTSSNFITTAKINDATVDHHPNKNEFSITSSENGDTLVITSSTSSADANEKTYYENEFGKDHSDDDEDTGGENTIEKNSYELYDRIVNKNSIIYNVSDNISTNDNDNVIEHLDTDSTNLNKNEKFLDNAKSVIKNTNYKSENIKKYENDDDDDEDDLSYEDDDYFSIYTSRRKTKHESIQRIALGKPLVQGFAMSPGYPKFYIGESDCEWTIIAPYDQKIRLTFLDISLRTDPMCRDYIQVVDIEKSFVLFNSCSELVKPHDVISESNQLKINFRTTTKMMFPKRGILFHYSALGCLTPPTPMNSQLVSRTEDKVKYICDSSYVFPDTAVSIRELVCTERHTWDNILPDCIEKAAAEGSGLVQHIDYNKKEASSMVDKTDTLYDIIIPSVLIAALFIVNGIVFVIIMRYRNKRRDRFDNELAEL